VNLGFWDILGSDGRIFISTFNASVELLLRIAVELYLVLVNLPQEL